MPKSIEELWDMYTQLEKVKENKSMAVINSVAQTKSGGKHGFEFVDNRLEAVSQKKMQDITNNYSALQNQGRVMPTVQMKGDVAVNDDVELEAETAVNGGRASQTMNDNSGKEGLAVGNTDHSNAIVQREYDGVNKLRIGIIHAGKIITIPPVGLPDHTYVWILSNKSVNANALDQQGVVPGQNASSPNQIISANQNNVKGLITFKTIRGQSGEPLKGLCQSGAFCIPRTNTPSNRNEYDYSFLRFAAIESYKQWYNKRGKSEKWPDIQSSKTLLETIDSDISGITGNTNAGQIADDTVNMKIDWLAEAGVYQWNWEDVKEEDRVAQLFTVENVLNKNKRDNALKEFADKYLEAEKTARGAVAGNMFQIYFPEPATRISSKAIKLLNFSGFGDMIITRGDQIGHKRESIGLIAGLVYLDFNNTQNQGRSKTKLKYDPSFVVTTGLGARKGSYISLFTEWYTKAKTNDEGFNDVDFNTLENAKSFDQSYLDPAQPGKVLGWHQSTFDAMCESNENAQKKFFHPNS